MERSENELVERARQAYEYLGSRLTEFGITNGFVMKTGFVMWLNENEDRVQQYEAGTEIDKLIDAYVEDCINEDERNDE